MLLPGPVLPAAMTNRVFSLVRASSSVACAIGSVQSVRAGLPRLIETTSAPWSTAHCMPAMIHEVSPWP